jgi:hypothetical protein
MISKLSAHLGPTSLFLGGSAPSLVLYLDAGNTFSYTGTGSTWYDLTSLNNDISLTNATFSSTYNNLTKFEGSFEFNGTDSFGSLISGTAIPLMNSHYTIESWFQANSYDSGENGGIIGWGNYGTASEVNALRQSGMAFTNYWWSNDLDATQATASTDYWYHIAATYDGTDRKIYLNGELLNSDTPGVSHSVPRFNNLKIGVTADYLDEYFNGKISMIKVWNKNLNSTQLLSSFNSNKSKYGYDFGSMTFNDTDSYLISTSNDYVLGTNDFTIEAFFKTATSSHNYGGIVSQRQEGNSTNISISLQSANTSEPLIEFCSAGVEISTYTASNDKWYHVAISRSDGTSSYFINGNLVNQFVDTTNYTTNNLVVGRYYTNLSDYYFNGMISNVRVLNGTGLYTGTFSIPDVQLSGTVSNTKLLITSQEVNPTKDITGLHSITASNIGWTSSLPYFYEFNYTDFSSTTGLELIGIDGISTNWIYLTTTNTSQNGNVYLSTAKQFNRSFSFEWVFECSGGNGADGFCVQWTTTNNSNGGVGGDVSRIDSPSNSILFQTWSNNDIVWYSNNTIQSSQNLSFSIRQNVYYWLDYNHSTSTATVYYSTSSAKPGSPQHTFNSFTFDSGNYYIGFGAATGGSVDNHILKSMKLNFL